MLENGMQAVQIDCFVPVSGFYIFFYMFVKVIWNCVISFSDFAGN